MQRKFRELLRRTNSHKKDPHGRRVQNRSDPEPSTPPVEDAGQPAIKQFEPDHAQGPVPARGRAMSVAMIQPGSPTERMVPAARPSKEVRLALKQDQGSPDAGGQASQDGSHNSSYFYPQRQGSLDVSMRGSGGGSIKSAHSPIMSLGGNPAMMTDAAQLAHNEDVADRNIERSGSRHTSTGQPSPALSDPIAAPASTKNSSRLGSLGAVSVPEDPIREATYDDAHTPEPYKANRASWPVRTARNESRLNRRGRKGSNDSTGENGPQASDYGPRFDAPEPGHHRSPKDFSMDGGTDIRRIDSGTDGFEQYPDMKGVVKPEYSEDADQTTQWAPAVTHEVVKPTTHEIQTERIFSEVHNHSVYHRVQPILQTEILPARHFVPDPASPNSNRLIEVSESQLPDCTGPNQKWYIGEKNSSEMKESADFPPPQARLTEPKVVDEKTYTTPEGFERTETVIVHPSTLEDLSTYDGPVVPVIFEEGPKTKEEGSRRLDRNPSDSSASRSMSLEELDDALPHAGASRAVPAPGAWPAAEA